MGWPVWLQAWPLALWVTLVSGVLQTLRLSVHLQIAHSQVAHDVFQTGNLVCSRQHSMSMHWAMCGAWKLLAGLRKPALAINGRSIY